MNKLFLGLSSLFLSILLLMNFGASSAGAKVFVDRVELAKVWSQVSYDEYIPAKGDYFLVDIEKAVGYLLNDIGQTYTSFPIMTGSKRTPTPEKDWVVLQKNIQPNRVVFAESGEFFRMFLDEGKTFTHYGIHGYGFFEEEIEKGTKFLSLGCVLVADDVLDLIEESYLANGESLNISTRNEINIYDYLDK